MFSMIIESQFLFFSNLITSPTEISIAPHTPSSCFYNNSNIMREDLSQNTVGKREGGKICNFGLLEEEGAIFCYLYLTLELLPPTGRSKKE